MEGTKWDYNGYTNTPKKGEIACGYFVSTTLKHMGFNWNRYKLAQMYSKKIVEKICGKATKFSTQKGLAQFLATQENGIYILGLSNHVGFIIKHQNSTFFIHSNYINNQGPIKENLNNSEALNNSDGFWLGKFTTNQNIKKWLNGSVYVW